MMRLFCWFCHKSVSNEVPDDTVVRAVCICPECIPSQLRAPDAAAEDDEIPASEA